MNVTACIVTRGDVDLGEVLASLPPAWPVEVWNNAERGDVAVFGRYLAAARAGGLAYVQDDDAVVSDPEAVAAAWRPGHVVCNMPPQFRPHYDGHALVGFGGAFAASDAFAAFARFVASPAYNELGADAFARTCDVVFTALTPRILVDVPHRDLPWATASSRMWRQPTHVGERRRTLDLALSVVDTPPR